MSKSLDGDFEKIERLIYRIHARVDVHMQEVIKTFLSVESRLCDWTEIDQTKRDAFRLSQAADLQLILEMWIDQQSELRSLQGEVGVLHWDSVTKLAEAEHLVEEQLRRYRERKSND
jgi:hypothetical protein